MHQGDPRYWAFISYSHRDKAWADWLHGHLESFRVPRRLVGLEGRDGPVPARLYPVFRDREELPTSADLGEVIGEALAASRFLIVICSPAAARSRWVDEEILSFKRLGRENRILCLIVEGEPNASDKPELGAEECFPKALRFKWAQGELGSERTEPIAADARDIADGKRAAFLKLAAGLLGVGYDTLRQREHERRMRRMTLLAGAASVLVLVLSTLTLLFFQQKRVAIREKQRAERQKALAMEAINELTYAVPRSLRNVPGTLPALRRIMEKNVVLLDRILALDPHSPDAQREKIVNQYNTGDRWMLLGDTSQAQAAYDEAYRQARVLAADPRDPKAQMDLATTYDRLGSLRKAQGDLPGAREAYEKDLAILHSLQQGPLSAQVRHDMVAAYLGLGSVHQAQGRLEEAQTHYERGLAQAQANAAGGNREQLRRLGIVHQHLGDVRLLRGDFPAAVAHYEKNLELARRLAGSADDLESQRGLAVAYERIGWLHRGHWDFRKALESFQKSLPITERLAEDRSNAGARTDLAKELDHIGEAHFMLGDFAQAQKAYERSLQLTLEVSSDLTNTERQRNLSVCHSRIGETRAAQGDHKGALEAYGKSMAMAQALARDKQDLVAQRDLEVLLNRMGDAHLAMKAFEEAKEEYEGGLRLAEELRQRDPSNTETQRDVAVSYSHLADLALAQDRFPEAQRMFEKVLGILEEQAKGGSNLQAQRDVAEVLGTLATVQLYNGQAQRALAGCLRALKLDPSQAQLKVALGHAYLFGRRPDQALAAYRSVASAQLPTGRTGKATILQELQEFRSRGRNPPDLDRVMKSL